MGLFKRKEIKSPYWYLSLEACKEELSLIERKKRELEHRLEILARVKSTDTIIMTEDTLSRPKSEVDWQISDIMSELELLDNKEELIRLEKRSKERATEAYKIPKQEKGAVLLKVAVNPGGEKRDLFGEVTLSQEEASHGVEKLIQFTKDGKSVRMTVKVPPGVKNGSKVRLKGQGLKGNPSGDLFLVIKIRPR